MIRNYINGETWPTTNRPAPEAEKPKPIPKPQSKECYNGFRK